MNLKNKIGDLVNPENRAGFLIRYTLSSGNEESTFRETVRDAYAHAVDLVESGATKVDVVSLFDYRQIIPLLHQCLAALSNRQSCCFEHQEQFSSYAGCIACGMECLYVSASIMLKDVETVARDSHGTRQGNFEDDFKAGDPQGYAAWKLLNSTLKMVRDSNFVPEFVVNAALNTRSLEDILEEALLEAQA